ncbi:ubiquilin [Nematocida major]|uniref:ubiquilin n=1 Tax=Nematocida major TaxID=1912982 RepID=UPI0020074262|nr:ubiquilin [Nematocida major]KAH9386373.1 ubiquilin [Nematocida major]
MKISVKTSKGEVYTVEVEGAESTILQLKTKISEQVDVPVSKIRLIHVGKLLKDSDPLTAYRLEEGSTVHLVVPSTDKKPSPASTGEQPSAQPAAGAGAGPAEAQGASRAAAQSAASGFSGGSGQIDQGFLNALSNMNGSGQAGTNAAMQNRVKELMKNPEQMKILMEASLSMQNFPEPTKKMMMDNINKFADMAKSNPEQFEAFVTHILDNPSMYMGPGMAGFPPAGDMLGAGRERAPAGAPFGVPGMPSFDREEALAKYKTELAELEQIGYSNVEMNLVALVCTEGDLTKAVNLIMDWTSEDTH